MNRLGLLLAGLLLIAGLAHAADVTLAVQSPTQNTDGTALTDLWGYEIDSVRVTVSAVIVSNRVQGFTFAEGPTNTTFFPARTNAPVGTINETNKVTGLTAGIYYFRARAVVADASESANSNTCTNRIGTPSTVPLVVIKP